LAKRNFAKALAGVSKGVPIEEMRKALEGFTAEGRSFILQTAISGPWSLVALVVNDANKITTPINTAERTISVDLQEEGAFEIGWAVLYGMNQPKTTAYILDNGQLTKLTEKRNAEAAKVWAPDPFRYPPK
jgi:hypothetical protein